MIADTPRYRSFLSFLPPPPWMATSSTRDFVGSTGYDGDAYGFSMRVLYLEGNPNPWHGMLYKDGHLLAEFNAETKLELGRMLGAEYRRLLALRQGENPLVS
jgi:hypothetical protein